jgi:thiol-disulfide isomerase/thioredoxin
MVIYSQRLGRLVMSLAMAVLLSMVGCGKKEPVNDATNPPPTETEGKLQAKPMDRYAWNLKTLVEAYNQAGFANPTWDEPARAALAAFAAARGQVQTNQAWPDIVAKNSARAVELGCQDPMVEYLRIRFAMSQTNSAKAFADALCQAAIAMNQSSYPHIRKFYAARRAGEQFFSAYGSKADRTMLHQVGGSIGPAREALKDPTIPVVEAYEICKEALEAFAGTKDMAEYQRIYESLEKPMFDKWPEDYRSWVIRGIAHTRMAWISRGSGWANTVTEDGWKGLTEHLDVAEKALTRAWELGTNDVIVPIKMLTVELGQGKGRERMELWFQRAMAIDTNSFEAANDKMYYLQPKWHGSEADMLQFGWECLESKAWGPAVNSMLLYAHEALAAYHEGQARTNYWKRPEVWVDFQATWERYFADYPWDTNAFYKYVWQANRAEQWFKVNEMIPKLGQKIDYDYFGGKPPFDEMASRARARAGGLKSDPMAPRIAAKRALMRIGTKVSQGKVGEEDLAVELKDLDAVSTKYPDAPKDLRAELLMQKAALYAQVLDKPEPAKALLAQIQQEFPETPSARSASRMLASFDKMLEAKKIQSALAVGEEFPTFAEKDLEGKALSLADYKGKVVLIDFWATWCGPCIAELPNVVAAYEKFRDQGFEVIGISLDSDRDALVNFTKEKKIAWPQYFDGEGSKLAMKYGIQSIPTTFLLDRGGKIVAKNLRGDVLAEAVKQAVGRK